MADELGGLGVSPGVAAGTVLRMPPPLALPADPGPSRGATVEAAQATASLLSVATDLEARAARAGGRPSRCSPRRR